MGLALIKGKCLPGRRSSKCKGPEVGVCLAGLRNGKETSVAGVSKEARGEKYGQRGTGARSCRVSCVTVGDGPTSRGTCIYAI